MNRDKQIARAMQRLRETFPFALPSEIACLCRYLHENDFSLDTDVLVLRAAEGLAGEAPFIDTSLVVRGAWGDVFHRWLAYTKRLNSERARRAPRRRGITSTEVGKILMMGLITRVVQ